VGDLDKPETIEPAVQGVDKIFLVTFNGQNEAVHGKNVIDAAKKAGSPHVVRMGAWGTEKCRIVQNHIQIEEALKSSGLPWTIIKPTFFMQNSMMAAPTIASDGAIYWDWQDGKVGMIDVRDIVDSAVGVLTGSGHEGKEYILTGPQALSFHDVAETLTKVVGKEVKYVSVPSEASKESMMKMGFPEWIVDGYVELSTGFAENFANDTTDNVQTLSGHAPRSYEQFATDFKQAFSAN